MRLLLTLVVMIFCAPAFAEEASLARGRAVSEAFLRGDMARVCGDMDAQVLQLFGSVAGLQAFRDELTKGFGEEKQVLGEETRPADGADIYLRRSRWSLSEAPVIMQLALAEGKVVGFVVKLEPVLAESRFLDHQTEAFLRLPFKGEWFVVWGGRSLEQNYHAANRAQRFAMDAVILRDGASHQGDPGTLENYHCWDQPILAPAEATVVTAVDGLPDNEIGSTDARNPVGNHVVLDFGTDEFGFLAHMRQGSVRVQAGETVTAGQELGRCGNSGNTSEPHLHFHLQTTPDLSNGEGLPAAFNDYMADGKVVEKGEPVAGQAIQPN